MRPPVPMLSYGASQCLRTSGDDEVEDHMPTDFHPAQDDACSPLRPARSVSGARLRASESTSFRFYNNMGCIHFMMHKPNLAIYYFNKET